MIELVELIKHYSITPQNLSPLRNWDPQDIRLSTLAYLNAYRDTTAMLQDLAKNVTDLEAEGELKTQTAGDLIKQYRELSGEEQELFKGLFTF